jgi:HAD superfamily hydrolase (TIGR01484 family)
MGRVLFEQQVQVAIPSDPRLVLVTDLDGTLLAGERHDRLRLYRWLAQERKHVLHLFATGRDLRSIGMLFDDPLHDELARPHLVIGDVGCTVACGQSLEEVPLVVDAIEERWAGFGERVLQLTQGQRGLSPQPVASRRRHAFHAEPDVIDPQLLQRLEAIGVDCLLSDGRYLDVLPAGVNKGSTLRRVITLLELTHLPVVVAGDTLNDLAMFQQGYLGIIVGNAEEPLLQCLDTLSGVYLARGHGCSGILEGLQHYGFGPSAGTRP